METGRCLRSDGSGSSADGCGKPPPSPAARGRNATPLLVGFDAAPVIDRVGCIGREVANYADSDSYTGLETCFCLGWLLSDVDTKLAPVSTHGVLPERRRRRVSV